ncbi:MAG TPA: hypothetical protein V6C88_12440, partial [Chroococcidiopsis sp.]
SALINDSERPNIDPDFEDVTEGEEQTTKEKLKSKWAQLEAMVGTETRQALIAQDILNHFDNRLTAPEMANGKGMIVCMSRRICAELYKQIKQLRPEWHSNDDDKGEIKVVITGSAADSADLQPHIRTKKGRDAIANRLRDPKDPLKLVIVRDMWLTGFDAPCLHTMYIDKPMKGHNLMQAIARVNRVFGGKEGGLVVDYLGIAEDLKNALMAYTERDRATPQSTCHPVNHEASSYYSNNTPNTASNQPLALQTQPASEASDTSASAPAYPAQSLTPTAATDPHPSTHPAANDDKPAPSDPATFVQSNDASPYSAPETAQPIPPQSARQPPHPAPTANTHPNKIPYKPEQPPAYEPQPQPAPTQPDLHKSSTPNPVDAASTSQSPAAAAASPSNINDVPFA